MQRFNELPRPKIFAITGKVNFLYKQFLLLLATPAGKSKLSIDKAISELKHNIGIQSLIAPSIQMTSNTEVIWASVPRSPEEQKLENLLNWYSSEIKNIIESRMAIQMTEFTSQHYLGSLKNLKNSVKGVSLMIHKI